MDFLEKVGLACGIIIAASILVGASYFVNDPATCPQTYFAQNCIPLKVCGVDSGDVAHCYNTATIAAPVADVEGETLYSGGLDGGFIVNCHYYNGASAPYCQPSYCNANATCLAIHNKTGCTAGSWVTSNCTNTCMSGYVQCFTSDECDIQVGSACTGAGGIPGTWSALCTCDIAVQHHLTQTEAKGSGVNANLWTTNYGVGDLFNASSAYFNASFIVNGTGCLIFNDSSYLCNASVSGGGGALYYSDEVWINKNASNYFIFNETYLNATLNNSPYLAKVGVGVCAPGEYASQVETTSTIGSGVILTCSVPVTSETDPYFVSNSTNGYNAGTAWLPLASQTLGNSTRPWVTAFTQTLYASTKTFTPQLYGGVESSSFLNLTANNVSNGAYIYLGGNDSGIAPITPRESGIVVIHAGVNGTTGGGAPVNITAGSGTTGGDLNFKVGAGGIGANGKAYFNAQTNAPIFNASNSLCLNASKPSAGATVQCITDWSQVNATSTASDYSPWTNSSDAIYQKNAALAVNITTNLTVGNSTVNTTITNESITLQNAQTNGSLKLVGDVFTIKTSDVNGNYSFIQMQPRSIVLTPVSTTGAATYINIGSGDTTPTYTRLKGLSIWFQSHDGIYIDAPIIRPTSVNTIDFATLLSPFRSAYFGSNITVGDDTVNVTVANNFIELNGTRIYNWSEVGGGSGSGTGNWLGNYSNGIDANFVPIIGYTGLASLGNTTNYWGALYSTIWANATTSLSYDEAKSAYTHSTTLFSNPHFTWHSQLVNLGWSVSGHYIDTDFAPSSNGTRDLGSLTSNNYWKNSYLTGTAFSSSIADVVTGTSCTVTDACYIPVFTESDPKWSGNYSIMNVNWCPTGQHAVGYSDSIVGGWNCTADTSGSGDYSPWLNNSVMIYQKNTALGLNVTWVNASKNVTTPKVFGGANANNNLSLYSGSTASSNITLNNRGVMSIGNQSRARVWVSSSPFTCVTPNQIIPFDTREFDSQNETNKNVTAYDTFTPKQDGYYQFNCHIQFSNPLDAVPYYLNGMINGNSVSRGDWSSSGRVKNLPIMLADIYYLNAGDNVTCRCGTAAPAGATALGGRDYTYMSLHKLS